MKKKYYLIKGTLHNVKEHDYSGDELFWIHGNIIKSADTVSAEDEDQAYYRRQKQPASTYGLIYRSAKPSTKNITSKKANNKRTTKKRDHGLLAFFGIGIHKKRGRV